MVRVTQNCFGHPFGHPFGHALTDSIQNLMQRPVPIERIKTTVPSIHQGYSKLCKEFLHSNTCRLSLCTSSSTVSATATVRGLATPYKMAGTCVYLLAAGSVLLSSANAMRPSTWMTGSGCDPGSEFSLWIEPVNRDTLDRSDCLCRLSCSRAD